MKKISLILIVTMLAGIVTGCYRETIHNIMATAGTTETTAVTVPENYVETLPWFETVPPETTEPVEPTIRIVEDLLPHTNSKWKVSFRDESVSDPAWDGTYDIYYALTEDGKCYVVMSAYSNWIFDNGVGTYTAVGGRLSVTLDGETVEYSVDVENQTCSLVSEKGHIDFQKRGDVCSITSDTGDMTMESIIAKAQINLDEDMGL